MALYVRGSAVAKAVAREGVCKNMLSAKRTRRCGRRLFVYHAYLKILMSFAGGFAGGFVFGKRTQNRGLIYNVTLN